jgi:hypothetical protein
VARLDVIDARSESGQRQSPRDAEDDFYCLRYQVWYPSHDCAFRTHFRTSPGCLDCQQGRFNLKRHADSLRRAKHSFVTLW